MVGEKKKGFGGQGSGNRAGALAVADVYSVGREFVGATGWSPGRDYISRYSKNSKAGLLRPVFFVFY